MLHGAIGEPMYAHYECSTTLDILSPGLQGHMEQCQQFYSKSILLTRLN